MLRLLTCIFLLLNASFAPAQFAGVNYRTIIIPSVTDSFPGTALSSNWTVPFGSFGVASNTAFGTATSGSIAAYTGTTFSNDQQACVTFTGNRETSSSNFVGPAVRVSSTSATGYLVNIGPSAFPSSIQSVINGTFVTLSTQLTLPIGETYCLSAVGSTITLTGNGAVVWTVTDTSITSGSPGMTAFASGGSGTFFAINSWTGRSL